MCPFGSDSLLPAPPSLGGRGRGHEFMAAQKVPILDQSWHRGFILCAMRVKAVFNSLLSLICSRTKGYGCGVGVGVEEQCAGAVVPRAAARVCPVPEQGGPGKGAASRTSARVKPKPWKSEGTQTQARGGENRPFRRDGGGAAPQTWL